MKKVLFYLLVFITIINVAKAQVENVQSQSVESKIDWHLRYFSGNNLGGVVAVYQKGEIKFEKAYGLSDMSNLTKMESVNRFNLVGLSKSFTSLAVLKLVEKGKISLDDNMIDIFNDFPDYGKEVKIKHLLSHTSGLENYNKDNINSLNEVYEFLKSKNGLKYQAGAKMEHSNSDYPLLVLIIEKLSGISYSDFLNKNIFKKIKMENTLVASNAKDVVDVALPHSINNMRYIVNETENYIYGEQGIYSNIHDIAKWDKALYTDKLLKCEYLSEIFKENKLNEDKTPTYYGYGWVLMERNDTPYYWHGGTGNGYTNLFFHLPNSQLTVVILVNREDEGDLFKIALSIAKLFDNNINL